MPPGFDYEIWLGPAPVKPYTVDRCHPQGTYWIYDQSIGYLGGWGAHPLDILVWGCDADLAGPWTVEGTGKVPDTGLYDTVYDWDMKFTFAGGVTMTFKPGKRLDQVHRHRGLDPDLARGLGRRAEVAAQGEARPQRRPPDQSARTTTRTSWTP